MPYIKGGLREGYRKIITEMAKADIKADGDLNFILFYWCKYHVKPSYNNYKNFIGELRQCATEIERRILAPYEDEKIKENGDV
jgi:hypothetical protein